MGLVSDGRMRTFATVTARLALAVPPLVLATVRCETGAPT